MSTNRVEPLVRCGIISTVVLLPRNERLSCLSSQAAAGLASVVLVVVFGVYLIPFYSLLGCELGAHSAAQPPDILSGVEHFDRPKNLLLVSIERDGSHFVGRQRVRSEELLATLQDVYERTPDRGIEIRGDRRVSTGALISTLGIIRDAGFSRVYVFGHTHSVLELWPQQSSRISIASEMRER